MKTARHQLLDAQKKRKEGLAAVCLQRCLQYTCFECRRLQERTKTRLGVFLASLLQQQLLLCYVAIMVKTALEEGFLEDKFEDLQARVGEDAGVAKEELKRENGDGPSLFLVNFMKNQGGVSPKGWEGWHPLTRK
jgi:hypothetical protein